MKNGLKRAFFSLLVTLASLEGAEGFSEYCNSRFGFCVDYPRELGMEPPPVNNDGRVFYNNEGFSLRVYGQYNALDERLEEHLQSLKGELDSVTYERLKGDWFVLSGYKGKDIHYIKVIYRDGTFYTLWIRYPSGDNIYYAKDIARISKSFHPLR